jgi:mono/diheme cytochrome c family protein
MRRTTRLPVLLLPLALLLGACGEQGIELPGENDQAQVAGAKIFDQRCAACHTLEVAGAQGSAFNVNQREYKDGPNFNARVITKDQALYAIRNGGFSSGPMPQNIVVGEEAEQVAAFLEKYSGREAKRNSGQLGAPKGASGESAVESSPTP